MSDIIKTYLLFILSCKSKWLYGSCNWKSFSFTQISNMYKIGNPHPLVCRSCFVFFFLLFCVFTFWNIVQCCFLIYLKCCNMPKITVCIYNTLRLCYARHTQKRRNYTPIAPKLTFSSYLLCFIMCVVYVFFLHILKRIINQSINLLWPFLCDPFSFYVLRVTCV